MNDFDFISSPLLRKNIESIQNDVFNLGMLLKQSKEKETRNCIRKTVVIYTVSIIEALLLWKLNEEIKKGNIAVKNRWYLRDIGVSVPLKSKQGNDIAIAEKIKDERTIEKIDFKRRIDLCELNAILKEPLIKKLHKARELRNKLHIDGIHAIRKDYSNKDIDFSQSVLDETRKAVQ